MVVCGAGAFLGSHLDAALARAGHAREATLRERADAVVHASPQGVRGVLDAAALRGARLVVFLSSIGADPRAAREELAARGRAEERVRASGLPWAVLRPEILWGPGDVFTNELAHLLRHLPFVPIPRGGPRLAPVYVGDVARAVVELLERRDLWRDTWELPGPETLRYGEVVERVAQAIRLAGRRRVGVPAWTVRLGARVEERIARRPRATRALLDRLVAGDAAAARELHRFPMPERLMSVEALRGYLWPERPLPMQLAPQPDQGG